MTQTTSNLLGIRRAALVIGYTSGMVNREQSEEKFLNRVDEILGADGVCLADLVKMDNFLLSLSDEEIEVLCDGEESEMYAVLDKYSGDRDQLDGLLNDIFDA